MGVLIVRQPPGSSICGHCCVASVTRAPLEDVIDVIGHRRGTTALDLADAMFKLGFEASITIDNEPETSTFIGFVRPPKERKCGHWILVCDGEIMDPSGIIIKLDDVKFAGVVSIYGRRDVRQKDRVKSILDRAKEQR